MPRLTELAHDAVRAVLRPGDIAIDATCGNGHDTRFLAEIVGPDGRVWAFDTQTQAIERTAENLARFTNVVYENCDHAVGIPVLLVHYPIEVAVAMFNLGYLPGGNKGIITRTDSTVTAIRSSLELLRPGGILTVIAYPGHAGGAEETEAVAKLLGKLSPAEFTLQETRSEHDKPTSPRLFVVRKLPL
ncbi:MAG: class I SAM-dependent methyltransferase [Gemmataceae bacterium]